MRTDNIIVLNNFVRFHVKSTLWFVKKNSSMKLISTYDASSLIFLNARGNKATGQDKTAARQYTTMKALHNYIEVLSS